MRSLLIFTLLLLGIQSTTWASQFPSAISFLRTYDKDNSNALEYKTELIKEELEEIKQSLLNCIDTTLSKHRKIHKSLLLYVAKMRTSPSTEELARFHFLVLKNKFQLSLEDIDFAFSELNECSVKY